VNNQQERQSGYPVEPQGSFPKPTDKIGKEIQNQEAKSSQKMGGNEKKEQTVDEGGRKGNRELSLGKSNFTHEFCHNSSETPTN